MEKEQFLSDQEIINSIIKYLDDQVYNYAVLIDGAWGTGKSYFVNETLLPAIKDYEAERAKGSNGEFRPHRFVYLSLYGINQTEEISRLLFAELCKGVVQNDKYENSKVLSWIGAGTRILADVIKNNSGLDLQKAAEDITKKSLLDNCVLIFDDLERVCCDINEVMGYINNLVEQEGLKVLIIANEKEIDNRSRLMNDPNELSFCLSDKIDYSDSYDIIIKQDIHDKISIKDLEDRANYVFPRNRNYKQIKEKLIGVTIEYCPDYFDLISVLTEKSISDPVLKEVIDSKKEELYKIATIHKHYNLRTFLFFLSKCVEIGKSLPDIRFIERILEYIFLVCVKTKTGDYDHIKWWREGDKVRVIPLSDFTMTENVLGFKFIDDYIVSSRLIVDDVKKDVTDFLIDEEMESKNENDPFNKLINWMNMEESEVQKCLDEMLEKLKNNRYSISRYGKILALISGLSFIGFDAYYEEQVAKLMKDNIMKADTELLSKISFPNSVMGDSYLELVRELKDLINKRLNSESIKQIDSLLEDMSSWGERIQSFVMRHFIHNGRLGLINQLDIDRLLVLIDESDSHNLNSFMEAVNKLYSERLFERYKDDYPNLKKIYDGLKIEDPNYDLIKIFHIKSIKRIISDIIKEMEPFVEKPEMDSI